MSKKEVTITQVGNGYIVNFESLCGAATEVYENFDHVVTEIRKFMGEEK